MPSLLCEGCKSLRYYGSFVTVEKRTQKAKFGCDFGYYEVLGISGFGLNLVSSLPTLGMQRKAEISLPLPWKREKF